MAGTGKGMVTNVNSIMYRVVSYATESVTNVQQDRERSHATPCAFSFDPQASQACEFPHLCRHGRRQEELNLIVSDLMTLHLISVQMIS